MSDVSVAMSLVEAPPLRSLVAAAGVRVLALLAASSPLTRFGGPLSAAPKRSLGPLTGLSGAALLLGCATILLLEAFSPVFSGSFLTTLTDVGTELLDRQVLSGILSRDAGAVLETEVLALAPAEDVGALLACERAGATMLGGADSRSFAGTADELAHLLGRLACLSGADVGRPLRLLGAAAAAAVAPDAEVAASERHSVGVMADESDEVAVAGAQYECRSPTVASAAFAFTGWVLISR